MINNEIILFDSIDRNYNLIDTKNRKGRHSEKIQKESDDFETISVIKDAVSEVKATNEINNSIISNGAIKAKNNYMEIKKKVESVARNPYTAKKSIMTSAEQMLFRVMKSEINSRLKCVNKEVEIFPMVRLADFINVNSLIGSNSKEFYRIAYKHIDFLVCDSENFDIIFAVELDDVYHNSSAKIERDNFVDELLGSCGITLFRINEKIRYVDAATLTNMLDFVLDYYAPNCPECGAKMNMLRSKASRNYGHRFYGCSRYSSTTNKCYCTIDIE